MAEPCCGVNKYWLTSHINITNMVPDISVWDEVNNFNVITDGCIPIGIVSYNAIAQFKEWYTNAQLHTSYTVFVLQLVLHNQICRLHSTRRCSIGVHCCVWYLVLYLWPVFIVLVFFVLFLFPALALCGRVDCPAAGRAAAEGLWTGLRNLTVHCHQHLWNYCLEGLQSHYCQHWSR